MHMHMHMHMHMRRCTYNPILTPIRHLNHTHTHYLNHTNTYNIPLSRSHPCDPALKIPLSRSHPCDPALKIPLARARSMSASRPTREITIWIRARLRPLSWPTFSAACGGWCAGDTMQHSAGGGLVRWQVQVTKPYTGAAPPCTAVTSVAALQHAASRVCQHSIAGRGGSRCSTQDGHSIACSFNQQSQWGRPSHREIHGDTGRYPEIAWSLCEREVAAVCTVTFQDAAGEMIAPSAWWRRHYRPVVFCTYSRCTRTEPHGYIASCGLIPLVRPFPQSAMECLRLCSF